MAAKFNCTHKGAFLICFFLLLTSCAPKQSINTAQPLPPKIGGQDCQQDTDCFSGVCNFIKQNIGQCMVAQCSTSEQAIGINGQTTFYCDHNNHWQKVKQFGETCNYDYECVNITCKDTPSCHPGDFKYYCQEHECVGEQQADPCRQQGLTRIIQKDEYFDKEQCIETFAQREIQTICAPCGDGICDPEIEFKCNCPNDCK